MSALIRQGLGAIWRVALSLFFCGSAASLVAAEEAAPSQPAFERLAGHGGPVKGLAVHRDAGSERAMALTASFDYALGFWDGETGERLFWLDGHDAAVNAVAFTPDGASALSASDDFTLRFWRLQSGSSIRLEGHEGKVADIAVSPDGMLAASASWDGKVGLWSLPEPPKPDAPDTNAAAPSFIGFLEGHRGAVNAVAFSADGQTLFSGSSDGTVRRWRLRDRAEIRIEASHGFGVNVLLPQPIAPGRAEDWLAYGAADGVVRVIDLAAGDEIAALTGDRRPILALAASPSGEGVAYGDGQGYITIVSVEGWRIERDFRAAARGPIWGLAYLDETRLLAAGLDDSVAIWPLDGDLPPTPLAAEQPQFQVDPKTVSNGERQFARKCSVCHTLTPDGARRAGPTLYGVFGRKAGAVEGYAYSPALADSDIVWTPETLDKLFDIGPDHYTPGSKMPMQRIVAPEDRADLIAYLQAVTPPAGAGPGPTHSE